MESGPRIKVHLNGSWGEGVGLWGLGVTWRTTLPNPSCKESYCASSHPCKSAKTTNHVLVLKSPLVISKIGAAFGLLGCCRLHFWRVLALSPLPGDFNAMMGRRGLGRVQNVMAKCLGLCRSHTTCKPLFLYMFYNTHISTSEPYPLNPKP